MTFYRHYNSAGQAQMELRYRPTDGVILAYIGSTLVATASAGIAREEWACLRIRHLIHGSTGVLQVMRDGNVLLDFSGDTHATGLVDIASYGIGWIARTGNGSTGDQYIAWDDLADNDTSGDVENGLPADGAVLLLKPNGNGASSQLVGSDGNQVDNYALVDEVPPDSADYVASSTPDQQDTYALEDVPAPYNAVRLVQPVSYAALATAGTGALRNVVRSGGTDYADAADTALGTTYGFVKGDALYTDPADDAPWTVAKVDALEAGPRVR
jgi:hypothetical protein